MGEIQSEFPIQLVTKPMIRIRTDAMQLPSLSLRSICKLLGHTKTIAIIHLSLGKMKLHNSEWSINHGFLDRQIIEGNHPVDFTRVVLKSK